MRHNLNLNWLRSFEATARHLSFTAASHEIGLTQTAVSQHIKALEMQLGDKLFLRRPKSLQLTDMGQAYLPKVRDALDMIEMSTTGLFGPRQTSTVTLRASMAFIMWIAPRLDGFLQKNPDIGVKLVTSIWQSPADKQPVDVDIVLAPNAHSRPDLEHLSDEQIVPVCGTSGAAAINTPEDLLHHPAIHILGFDDHWGRYLSAFSLQPTDRGQRLMTDTSTAAIEMVASGLGCAVVIERFAAQAMETGRAIHMAGPAVSLGQSHYFVQPAQTSPVPPGTELLKTWIRSQF